MEIPKPTEDDKQFFRSVLPADPELAAGWVEKARVHVGSMPPKVKKPRKTRAG